MSDRAEPARSAGAGDAGGPKPNNLRTGLLLAAVALFFFLLMFVKRLWLD